jgi:hypothetical protein
MKVVIVVLVVIALAFAFVAIQGGTRSDAPQQGQCAPPKITGDGSSDEDMDAVSKWTPCGTASLLGKITAPFAPKVKLTDPTIVLTKGTSDMRFFAASTSDMRVARVQVLQRGAMLVSVTCIQKDGRSCPKPICICAPGASFGKSEIGSCPEFWRDAHADGASCKPDDATTSLNVYPEAGTLSFTALGEFGATAQVAQ